MEVAEKLPAGVYKKHSAYYVVTQNKWVRLGKTLGESLTRLEAFRAGRAQILPPKNGKDWLEVAFRVILANSKGRAKKIGLEHTVTMADLKQLAADSRYCCAVTGLMFSNEKQGKSKTRPFFPSLDRKDSSKGYTPDNCRLVSVVANYAMNAWGEEMLTTIAVAHLKEKQKSLRRSKKAAYSLSKPAQEETSASY